MTSLDEIYEQEIARLGFNDDTAQRALLAHLEQLRRQLIIQHTEPKRTGLISKLFGRLQNRPATITKGLYVWGGVGRGKTWLMDLFYANLPFEQKRRVHFHRFMQSIHRELRSLDAEQNPLTIVAKRLASQCRVLCFDEFYVSDIADAMLLAGLFEGLFSRGVVLVATSNTPPDELYRGGLQRARFLPAIELIKNHTTVVAFADGDDYRLRTLEKNNVYHHPADDKAQQALARSFTELSGGLAPTPKSIDINGRMLATLALSDDIAWFDFDTLCRGHRASDDYIELAQCFKAIIVSDVPVFTTMDNDAARRFINMVDEFYDRGINLVLSAAVAAQALYQGTKLAGPFERTSSRLIEMQSHEYLSHAKSRR